MSEWKPIETAPENIPILIAGGKAQSVCSGNSKWFINENVYIGLKYKREKSFTVSDYFSCKPTHWMPLPSPPEAKE